jgi:hypothetical protein
MAAPRLLLLALAVALAACCAGRADGHGVHPLSRIAIHRARVALDASSAVRASPKLLGSRVCILSFVQVAILLLVALAQAPSFPLPFMLAVRWYSWRARLPEPATGFSPNFTSRTHPAETLNSNPRSPP